MIRTIERHENGRLDFDVKEVVVVRIKELPDARCGILILRIGFWNSRGCTEGAAIAGLVQCAGPGCEVVFVAGIGRVVQRTYDGE